MELFKTILIIVGAIFSSVFLAIFLVGIYTEIKDRLNLVKRLHKKIIDLGESNVNRINAIKELRKDFLNNVDSDNLVINSILKRLREVEEQNKEINISIEFLREADAEVRWKLFGPEIKKDLKTGRVIKSRKRGI